jgi:hypothetical protein
MRGLASTLEACRRLTTDRLRAYGSLRVSGHRETAGCADLVQYEILPSFTM